MIHKETFCICFGLSLNTKSNRKIAHLVACILEKIISLQKYAFLFKKGKKNSTKISTNYSLITALNVRGDVICGIFAYN